MKKSAISYRASCIVFLILALLLPSLSYAAPQMADYCYIPPFVTDPNTPPNVIIAYERDSDIIEQVYDTDFSNSLLYAGFFDASSNYAYDSTNNYFEKSTTCTTSATDLNCIPGRALNWGLMSGLDLSRRVLVGFGWNELGSKGGGDVFTYKGCFVSTGTVATCEACTDAQTESPPAGCQQPISFGYLDEGTLSKSATVSIGGSNYSYRFCLSKASGSNPTEVTVVAATGDSPPACPNNQGACNALGVGCVKFKGRVAMRFTTEDRKGIVQKFADKDENYIYDSDGIRFGVRRWATATDKQKDIMRDVTALSDDEKKTVLRGIISATTKAPPVDGGTPLSDMMYDIRKYFSGNATLTYADGSGGDAALTQTPYAWANDPARDCRKNVVLFVTRGTNLGTQTATDDCSSDTSAYKSKFSEQTCYAFNTDLYTAAGTTKQNISTYMVQVSFHLGVGAANADQIKHAVVDVGGGIYTLLTNPSELQAKLEEALLNIISTSASASTVATLTTQTRESSTLTQAYFYPKREGTPLKWIGYLRLLWSDGGGNLREDTRNRGWLDLKKDKILTFWYSATGCNNGPCYRAKLYDDLTGDLKIDTCSINDNTNTINNEAVSVIWNAQDKLLGRHPSETDADKRKIKVGIGNTTAGEGLAGIVKTSACLGNRGFCDFETALNTTLQPYLSPASYCSDWAPRWCNSDAGCNYCSALRTANVDRVCTVSTQATDCAYCNGKKDQKCTTALTCSDGTGNCTGINAGAACSDATGVCIGGCYSGDGSCNTGGSLSCSDGSAAACAALNDDCGTGGKCQYKCTITTTKYCSVDTDCGDLRGTGFTGAAAQGGASACLTNDTCTPAAANTCTKDCDDNCAKSVIKFMRGYDKPSYSAAPTGPESPGKDFRLRTQCVVDTDCSPTGQTCGSGVCSVSGASCSNYGGACTPDGGTCYGTCSSNSYDITKTLKLGDVVYSTPRISPNSAVNGYDVTYGDTSYKNWINGKIKGNCSGTDATECPSGETCANSVCLGDGYTPIVLLGANDGMVHAFKVSKIKDLSPAEDDCYNVHSGPTSCAEPAPDVTSTPGAEGSQVARFAALPRSTRTVDNGAGSDTAPPTDLGKEMWAYVPFNSVPYLRWYCDKGYCHIPMVDARFTVVDASIDYDKDGTIEPETGAGAESNLATDPRSTSSPYPWRRLLVGAMGAGGKQITVGSNTWSSSVFVLDITNSSNPVLLWEKPLPDGTLTTSTPAIIRLASAATTASKNENGKWYLLIGSGPSALGTKTVTYKSGNANIYVFDLRNGDLKKTLSTGVSGAAVGDLMAVDMDKDYQVDDVYFGTYSGVGGSETGDLYRLRIRNNTAYKIDTSTEWTDSMISKVVTVGRPIYASPEIASDSSGNKWLYFGTGVYLSGEHATATTRVEYLYGVKESENCWKGSGTCSEYTNFLDTSAITFTGAQAVELGCSCSGNQMGTVMCNPAGTCGTCADAGFPNTDTVVLKVQNASIGTSYAGSPTNCTNKTDVDAINCIQSNINSSSGCNGSACNGWKRGITGQKMFSKPFVAGGLVDFTSFQPTSTSCSLGGNTHLWSLHYTTGTAYVQPTIFQTGGTSGATTSLTISASVNLGTGVPPLGESLVALPLSGDTYKVITQVSGGLPGTSMAPSLPAKSGYVLWIVK